MLLISHHPTETGAAPTFACRRLLVPLDGTLAHELGLAVAVSLAQVCATTLQRQNQPGGLLDGQYHPQSREPTSCAFVVGAGR